MLAKAQLEQAVEVEVKRDKIWTRGFHPFTRGCQAMSQKTLRFSYGRIQNWYIFSHYTHLII